jgi:hypothetical protein
VVLDQLARSVIEPGPCGVRVTGQAKAMCRSGDPVHIGLEANMLLAQLFKPSRRPCRDPDGLCGAEHWLFVLKVVLKRGGQSAKRLCQTVRRIRIDRMFGLDPLRERDQLGQGAVLRFMVLRTDMFHQCRCRPCPDGTLLCFDHLNSFGLPSPRFSHRAPLQHRRRPTWEQSPPDTRQVPRPRLAAGQWPFRRRTVQRRRGGRRTDQQEPALRLPPLRRSTRENRDPLPR